MDEETKELISAGGKVVAHMRERMDADFKLKKNMDVTAVEAKIDSLQDSSDALDASQAHTENLDSSHKALKKDVLALLVEYPMAVQSYAGKDSPEGESAPHYYHAPHSSGSTTVVPAAPTTPAGQ